MKKRTLLFVAALVVLAILVVHAVIARSSGRKQDPGGGERPGDAYRRTTGGFDAAARRALAGARRPNATQADHALAAAVITRGILGQEHRPARDAAGAPTPRAVAAARERQQLFGEARGHFMAALGAPRPPLRPTRGRAAVRFEDNFEHILDAAALFAFGGIQDLLANDRTLAELIAEDRDLLNGHLGLPQMAVVNGWEATPDEIAAALGALWIDAPLAAAATEQRRARAEERRELAGAAAAARGAGRGAAVAAYVELATQNTDDPQNAHDPGVLACLRAVVERLRADQAGQAVPTTAQVVAAIRAAGPALSEGRPARVADAVAAAERTAAGERVVAIGATDGECLGRVWLRASDPRNAAVQGAIRQAVFDALVDMWEPSFGARHIVCVNGRTSRLLASLVLLDWDRRNWEVKKLEQFKNDIFEKARGVADAEAKKAAAGGDPAARAAGRAYLARTTEELRAAGDVPEDATARLEETMRSAIGAMVDAHVRSLEEDLGVKGAIPAHMVAGVKEEAQAAV